MPAGIDDLIKRNQIKLSFMKKGYDPFHCIATLDPIATLIHGYTVTDDEIVWRTAQTSVPVLRNKIDELLKQLGEL